MRALPDPHGKQGHEGEDVRGPPAYCDCLASSFSTATRALLVVHVVRHNATQNVHRLPPNHN